MNIEEFLTYKEQNPESASDFLFLQQNYEGLEKMKKLSKTFTHNYYQSNEQKLLTDLFNSICQTQKQHYDQGTISPKVERVDLQIFIS